MAGRAYSAQSTIIDVDGYSCLGEDKTRKQTEQAAFAEAKRRAGELTVTHIKSETRLKNLELEKDIVESYMNAAIKVVQELEKGWYKEEAMGDCYRVKIKAEVTPEEKQIEKAERADATLNDPGAPLNVKIWADRKEYRKGEKIVLYLKGNKPFYARIIYKDASDSTVQLLPNPYRTENHFNGGVVYQLPSAGDRFDLEVFPPFGEESITIYASTAHLGDIDLKPADSVFQILSDADNVGLLTRGVKIVDASTSTEAAAQTAEFVEENIVVKTK